MKRRLLWLAVLAISARGIAQTSSSGQPGDSMIKQSSTLATADARPEILVLGTYHMANPGHDIYNMKADDVLSEKRQQEIAQLIEVLKRFHPTKIAIESNVGNSKRPQQYADYLAGKYTLTQNEIDQ